MYVNVCEKGFLSLCILYITEKQMNEVGKGHEQKNCQSEKKNGQEIKKNTKMGHF